MTLHAAPATSDLCDAYPDVRTAQPVFRDYGGTTAFCGPAFTVRAFEDNTLVRSTLETPGEGRVLVVEGGREPELRACWATCSAGWPSGTAGRAWC